MEKIAILTDSASNIKENIDQGIFVVPLYVNFENESKKDLLEITPAEVFSRIDENPYTSAPSIDDFCDKISLIKEKGYDKILAIGVSKNLSGTFNTMRLALEAGDMEYFLIDSMSITMPEGLLVMYARSLIEEGKSFDDLQSLIEGKIKDLKMFASVSDLKYLIRGGRLSKVEGLIGGSLRINPVLTIDNNGEIKNYKSVVGKKRAVNFIAKETQKILEGDGSYYMALAYGEDPSDIDDVKDKLSGLIDEAALYLEGPVTAVLGCHSGPSVNAVCFLKID